MTPVSKRRVSLLRYDQPIYAPGFAPNRQVAVLGHRQNKGDTPRIFIPRELAVSWWQCGGADWLSRWTIKLKKPLPLKLRGPSANIREHTILKAIAGSQYHRALIESWA